MKLVYETTTDALGAFFISGLKPGTYTLQISPLVYRLPHGRMHGLTATVGLKRHDDALRTFTLQYVPD